MVKKTIFIAAAWYLTAVFPVMADTIYLVNGRSMEGFIVEETPESYVVDVGFGRVGLKRSEVKSVSRSAAEESWKLRDKWARQKAASEELAKEEKRKEELAPKGASITEEKGQLVVQALLNNKVNASLIMDTGASLVVIKDSLARQLGIDPSALKQELKMKLANGKESIAKHAVLDRVSVQGAEALNVDAAILPADVVDPELKDGLLGMSYLRNFSVKIDHKNKRVTLERF